MDEMKYVREAYKYHLQYRGAFTMNDTLILLRHSLPAHVWVRLLVVQGQTISKFREFLYKIGLWFIKKSGLEIGEG